MAFTALTLSETITFTFIPLVSDLWPVYLFMFIISFGMAYFQCGALVGIISMWKSKSYQIIHLTHAIYSFGVLLAPIINAPFVLGDVTKTDQTLDAFNTTLRDQINYSINRRPNLMIPFLIGGAISALSKNSK